MDRSAFIKTLKEVMKKTQPLHLIMNLSQSLLKGLWNYIMGFIFKQRQIRIYGGKLYGKL